jgi:hypothetical protein
VQEFLCLEERIEVLLIRQARVFAPEPAIATLKIAKIAIIKDLFFFRQPPRLA